MKSGTESLQQDRLIASSAVSEQDLPRGSLYVVGMPIGNAADITLRALWVLSQVDAIAAEDTRLTRPLLARYAIDAPLIAAHQHNERQVGQQIVQRLARGERIALVSDAGTPGVSDPGALIVRAALDAGHRVIPIPGPSSAIAAVSAAGLDQGPFVFAGFLPTGAHERERALRALAADGRSFIVFEAPHRIAALVVLLQSVLHTERRVVLARELSKKFESISACPAGQLHELALQERGEYVLLVDAAPLDDSSNGGGEVDQSVLKWLTALLDEIPPARAAAIASKVSGHPKQALYQLALQLKRQ